MESQKIKSVAVSLGCLAGRVDPEAWALVKLARASLFDSADYVEEMESGLVVPEHIGVSSLAAALGPRPATSISHLVGLPGPQPVTNASQYDHPETQHDQA